MIKNNSPDGKPDNRSDLTTFLHTLSEAATQTNTRIRITMEMTAVAEKMSKEVAGETAVMDAETYIALLDSATMQLREVRDGFAPSAVAAGRVNQVTAAADFWRSSQLFTDRGEKIITDDGDEVELVELPEAYLSMTYTGLEQAQSILLAELNYIDQRVVEQPVAWAAAAGNRKQVRTFKKLLRQIKKILAKMIEPDIKTSATTLQRFAENWENALDWFVDNTLDKTNAILGSLNPLEPINWGKAAQWLTKHGLKLPKAINRIYWPLQELVRSLLGYLGRLSTSIRDKFGVDLKLEERIRDLVLQNLSQALLNLPKQALKHVAVRYIWRTHGNEDLDEDFLVGRLNRRLQAVQQRLGIDLTTRLRGKRLAPVRGRLERCLEENEETMRQTAWTMYSMSQVATAVGMVFFYLDILEPGLILEGVLGASMIASLGIVMALGMDVLYDKGSQKTGYFRGVGSLALRTLDTIQ